MTTSSGSTTRQGRATDVWTRMEPLRSGWTARSGRAGVPRRPSRRRGRARGRHGMRRAENDGHAHRSRARPLRWLALFAAHHMEASTGGCCLLLTRRMEYVAARSLDLHSNSCDRFDASSRVAFKPFLYVEACGCLTPNVRQRAIRTYGRRVLDATWVPNGSQPRCFLHFRARRLQRVVRPRCSAIPAMVW